VIMRAGSDPRWRAVHPVRVARSLGLQILGQSEAGLGRQLFLGPGFAAAAPSGYPRLDSIETYVS